MAPMETMQPACGSCRPATCSTMPSSTELAGTMALSGRAAREAASPANSWSSTTPRPMPHRFTPSTSHRVSCISPVRATCSFSLTRTRPIQPEQPAKKGKKGGKRTSDDRWSEAMPIFVRAMALADKTLFSWPDYRRTPSIRSIPRRSSEGRRGGVLWAVSTVDGKRLSSNRLDASPVFDGVVAAGDRLYISLASGGWCAWAASNFREYGAIDRHSGFRFR